MAILTTVNNPFDPFICREVKEIEVGKPIYASIDGFYCHFDVVVSLNGMITYDYEYIIKEDDHIGFVAVVNGGGGGRKVLMAVAMVALTVVSYGAGSAYGASMGSALGVSTAAGTAIVQAGVMIAGGMLINALLPPSFASVGAVDGTASSPTYGWDNAKNQMNEGTPLPIVYGKTKVVPPIISMYVESKDNKQYLNVLYALNDGEITSVSNIMINDNPISFYNSVSYSIRLGTNDQTLIPSFDNTRVDTQVNTKLLMTETVRRTSYNSVSGLTIIISAPSGIYFANDAGGLDSRSVGLEVKYRKVGDTLWATVPNTSISGASTSTIRVTFSADAIPSGQYDISVRRTTAESTATRIQDKVYFEGFTEIIYDDFTYPNTALLSIRALATDQLNGSMPTVSCVVDRGFGTSNPSIAAQNIISLEGGKSNLQKFDEFKTYCNDQNFKCNLVFDSEINVRDALNMVGMLGRANIIQIGDEYIPIIERAETIPTQKFLFTMGNIIRDSFKEEYLPLADRSNIIEVTYFDEAMEYDRQSVEIYQHGYDESTDTARKASVTLYGCTSHTQAIRHARFMMNKNRFLTNTTSFEADVDAIACTIGSVIGVSHDVPQWGYSGRLLSTGIINESHWSYVNNTTINGVIATSSNTTIIQLDRELSIIASVEYGLTIRLHDDTIVSVSLVTSESLLTDTIIIPIALNVSKFDLYAFGEINRVSKLFRVASITRSSDQRRKISAIEYIPEVYNDSLDTITIPSISSLSAVSYLMLTTDTEVASDGRSINIINLLWSGQGIAWDVYMQERSTDTPWMLIGNTQNHYFQLKDVKSGYYSFRVGDKEASSTIMIARVPLNNVENFISFYQNNQLVLRWDAVVDDYRTPIIYEVRRGTSWNNSEILGKVNSNSLVIDSAGTYWVKAYYKDLNDVEVWSVNETGISISSANILRNVVATWDEYATAWSGTKTNLNVDAGKLVLPMGTTYGYYDIPTSHIVTLSTAQLCRLSITYSVAGGGDGVLWDDINVMFDSYPNNIDGDSTGSWTAKPKISISQDGTTWGAWQDFVIGDYVGKAFKARIELYSNVSDFTVLCDGFLFTVDMPDRIDKGTLSVPALGQRFNYAHSFQTKPNAQITIVSAQQGDKEVLTNEDATGFNIQIINGGVGVARTINYLSQGY
ncbi:MAG: hypothetical protein JZU49_02780 [Sulfuricurvum sp.]|nr:hypothetical protein [Sulfuricurvum sp.]